MIFFILVVVVVVGGVVVDSFGIQSAVRDTIYVTLSLSAGGKK